MVLLSFPLIVAIASMVEMRGWASTGPGDKHASKPYASKEPWSADAARGMVLQQHGRRVQLGLWVMEA